MAKALNFNKVKKTYMTITLADEAETTLMIGTPTKAIMDDLMSLQDNLVSISDDRANTEATGELYKTCAKLMSRNKGGIKITAEYLENIFDFEDIIIFFNAYMEFIAEVTGGKN